MKWRRNVVRAQDTRDLGADLDRHVLDSVSTIDFAHRPPDDVKMVGSASCFDLATVEALDSGQLEPATRRSHLDHAAGCRDCWSLIVQAELEPRAAPTPSTTVTDAQQASVVPTKPVQEEPALHEPELAGGIPSIARYKIREPLGAGGGGIVYAAYDPELDRKVAIKLLRPEKSASRDSQQRLLREAQAMARVSHPNVNTVHDVGIWDRQVYLAMELVDGTTLRQWLRERPRTRVEIVAMFVQAGRGLAAAHAAGLVHSDFKPANVLVGADGRVRVTDFGLARPASVDHDDEAPTMQPRALLGRVLTHPGAIAGTPGYIAPERYKGRAVDARADQYAFAIALHEALFGEHPYAAGTGESKPMTAAAGPQARKRDRTALSGQLPPGAHDGAPERFRQIALKACSLDPAERYPSMATLLADLERDPRARWRKAIAIGGVTAAVAVAAALAWHAASRRHSQLCTGAERRLVGVWDPARRTAVAAAFRATGRPASEDTYARAATALDDYAGGWVAAYTEACEATRVRGEQTDELLALRMACLEQRRANLDALVTMLAKADAATVDEAVTVARQLPRLDHCNDIAALRAPVPPPDGPVATVRVAQLRAELAQASAERLTARYRQALATTERVVADATELGYRPLEAEALDLAARIRFSANDVDRAEQSEIAALSAALAGRDDMTAASAMIGLVMIVARKPHGIEEADRWARTAAASIERLGGNKALEADLEDALAYAYFQTTRTKELLAHAERAVKLRTELFGPDDPATLAALDMQASALESASLVREAAEIERRVLAARRRILGPVHADTARIERGLAHNLDVAGHPIDAIPLLEDAATVEAKIYGPDSTNEASPLNELAYAEFSLGRYRDAEQVFRRVIAIRQKAYHDDDPDLTLARVELAETLSLEGRRDEAMQLIDRAEVAAAHGSRDANGQLAQYVQGVRASVLEAFDAHAEALAVLRALLPTMQKQYGPDSEPVAQLRVTIAEQLRALHRFSEALEENRRALAVLEPKTDNANVKVHALDLMADTLREQGKLADASALAVRALALMEQDLGKDAPTPEMAYVLVTLATIELADHHGDDALAHFQRALDLLERCANRDSPILADSLTGLGRSQLERGRPADAIAPLERALALQKASPTSAWDSATTRFALARALWEAGQDRGRALDLAHEALDVFRRRALPLDDDLAEVTAWLSAHRKRP